MPFRTYRHACADMGEARRLLRSRGFRRFRGVWKRRTRAGAWLAIVTTTSTGASVAWWTTGGH